MYLIDGHNLIGSGLVPEVHLSQEDDEWRLVQWLRARQQRLQKPIMVVFDGGIPGGTSVQLSGGGVKVIFAASYRQKADTIILRRASQQIQPHQIVVVSNDADLARAVKGAGVRVMRCEEFVPMVNDTTYHRRTIRRRRPVPEPKLPRAEVEAWLALFETGNDPDTTEDTKAGGKA